MVGRTSIIKYFCIAYALQCRVAKEIKLKRRHFCTNPVLLLVSVKQCFADYDFLILSQNLSVTNERLYGFDDCLQKMDELKKLEFVNNSDNKDIKHKAIQNFAINLFRSGLYDDALECFDYVLALSQQSQNRLTGNAADVGINYFIMGKCMENLGKRKTAFQFFQKSINSYIENLSESADTQHLIGRCLLEMNMPNEAIKQFKTSLLFLEQESSDTNIDNAKAMGNYWVGVGFVKVNMSRQAKKYLKKALQIKQRISSDNAENEVADIQFWYGRSIYHSDEISFQSKYAHALRYFERSLKIKNRASVNGSLDEEVAEVLYWIGLCLKKTAKRELAINRFIQVLKIREKISFDASTDEFIAKAQLKLGECLLQDKKADEAFRYFKNVMEITKRIYPNAVFDFVVSEIPKAIYRCCFELKQPEKALSHFEQLLQVEEQMSSNNNKDLKIAETFDYISKCYLDMKNLCKAAEVLNRECKIYNKTWVWNHNFSIGNWVLLLKGIRLLDYCCGGCRTN